MAAIQLSLGKSYSSLPTSRVLKRTLKDAGTTFIVRFSFSVPIHTVIRGSLTSFSAGTSTVFLMAGVVLEGFFCFGDLLKTTGCCRWC